MSTTELYNKLMELVDAGDEQAAKDFLIEHIKEFPEDVRNKIIFEFFEDAVDQQIENSTNKAEIQKQGLEALKEIGKAEDSLKDEKKAADVRAKLEMAG